MLADEYTVLIPTTQANEYESSFPWIMAAIAVVTLFAGVAMFRWLMRRTADRPSSFLN